MIAGTNRDKTQNTSLLLFSVCLSLPQRGPIIEGYFPGQEMALAVIQRRQGAQQKLLQAQHPSDFLTPLFPYLLVFLV